MAEKALEGNKKVTYKFGQSDIDLNKYIHNLGTNLLAYMNSKNFNDGLRLEFTQAYDRYLTGLKDLSTNNTNRFYTHDNGSIMDTYGEFSSKDNDNIDPIGSEYYYDNNGNRISTDDFNTLKLRKLKNYNTFSANNEVATYFNHIGNALKGTTPSEATKTNKFNLLKSGFLANFNETYNPTGEVIDPSLFWDKDTVDSATGKRGTTNRANFLRELIGNYAANLEDYDFSGTPFKNKEAYISRLQAAQEKLANGYNSDAALALNLAGIGGEFLRNFFNTGELAQQLSTLELEYKQSEEERLKKEYEQLLGDTIYNNKRDDYFKSYVQQNPFKSTLNASAAPLSYSRDSMLNHIIKKSGVDINNDEAIAEAVKTYINFPDLSLYIRGNKKLISGLEDITAKHVSNNLDFAANTNLFTNPVGNTGYYVIPGSENYNNWSYIAYNPKLRKYEELSMLLNEELKQKMAYSYYDKLNKQVPKNQLGGTFADLLKIRTQANKKSQIKLLAESIGRDPNKAIAGNREIGTPINPTGEWSTVDKVRLGSAAADIGSLVSAYIPGYGTAASAVLGVGSTLGNLGADIADESTTGWDTARNFGVGIASDLVGLIPGLGSAGKVGKIAKTLKYILPTAMAGWSAYSNGGLYILAANKLMSDPNKMTVDDWRSLGEGLLVTMGLGKVHAGNKWAKKYTDRNITTEQYTTLRSKSGKELRFSPEKAKLIQKAKGYEELNKVFLTEHPGESLSGEFNWKTWSNPKISKGVEYTKSDIDYSKLERIPWGYKAKNGEVVPEAWSNDAILSWLSNKRIWKGPNMENFGTKKNPLYNPQLPTVNKSGGTLNLSLVRKFLKAGKITNTTSTANWFNDMYSSNPMKQWLGTFNKDNFNDFNNLLKSWSTNLKETLYVPGATPVSYNKGVFDRLALWNNTGTNNVIESLATSGVITRLGVSGDNASKGFLDGYFGTLEYLRHGGTKDSWIGKENELKLFQGELATKGLNYALDNESGMYLLSPVTDNSAAKSTTVTTIGGEKKLPNSTPKSGVLSGVFNNPTTMYGLPRAMYADRMNRNITDLAKDSITPLLKDPTLVHRATRGDLDAEMRGTKTYASLRNMASLPISSDANVQQAVQLEAELKGQEAINAGKVQSNQTLRLYDELAWQQEKENSNNRHETAMFNRALTWAANLDKSKMEQAYLAKKHNIWDVLGQLVEFDARTKQLESKAIERSFTLSDIDTAVTSNLKDYAAKAGILLSDMEVSVWDAVNSGTRRGSELTAEEALAYQNAAKIAAQIKQDQLSEYLNIGKSRWSTLRNSSNSKPHKPIMTDVPTNKGGGTLFAKSRIEAINKNEQVLGSLSKSLHEIIKSSIK